VSEQPGGGLLPTRFRSVLYLDVFGWLTHHRNLPDDSHGQQVKRRLAHNLGGDHATVSTESPPPEDVLPDESIANQDDPEMPLLEKEQKVRSVLGTFERETVKELMSDSERNQVQTLLSQLQESPVQGQTNPEHDNPKTSSPPDLLTGASKCSLKTRNHDWLKLNTFSDCGQRTPYFVATETGEIFDKPPQEVSGDGESEPQLPLSLSFAVERVDSLRRSQMAEACAEIEDRQPSGQPTSFHPVDRPSSSACLPPIVTSTSSLLPAQPWRPEDVEIKKLEGLEDDAQGGNFALKRSRTDLLRYNSTRHSLGTIPEKMEGVGPAGVVPHTTQNTFHPDSFMPITGPDSKAVLDEELQDRHRPGKLPWIAFRLALVLLCVLWGLGTVWTTVTLIGVHDIHDKPLFAGKPVRNVEEQIEVRENQHEPNNVDTVLGLPHLDNGGSRVLTEWPFERFQPLGLSCDDTGRHFVFSDEFQLYSAVLQDDALDVGARLNPGTL